MTNTCKKELQTFKESAYRNPQCNLTDLNVVLAEIENKYQDFVKNYHHKPKYLECQIAWKDGSDRYNVIIQLSKDINPEKDDDIFFYCPTIEDLKSLVQKQGEDFIITECHHYFR